jgi:hypothetical protein
MELTTGGPHVEGCLGAVFLLAPLALAGVLWPQTRFLLLAALATVVSFPAARSARYLIPALPMIAIAITFVLSRVSLRTRFLKYGRVLRGPGADRGSAEASALVVGAAPSNWTVAAFLNRARRQTVPGILLAALVIAHLVTCWPPLLDRRYRNPGWHVTRIPWKVALRKVPEDSWRIERSEEYAITRKIDAVLPKDEPVFSMGCPAAKAYTERDIIVVFQSARGEDLGDLLYTTWDSAVSKRRRWRFRFPAAIAREVRLVQQGHSTLQQWSVNEIGLQSNGAEVPIGPGAHPYAWPNPWDAGLAFDGSSVTRWRTWEPLQPGMRLGVRFGAPVHVDGLTVLDLPDQYEGRMSLEVLGETGPWVEEPPPVLESVPAVDLRREATQVLKRAGIHFILLSQHQWKSEAFLDAAGDWGLAPVTGTLNYTLFRIE